MINIKNILKVLLVACFICVCSTNSNALVGKDSNPLSNPNLKYASFVVDENQPNTPATPKKTEVQGNGGANKADFCGENLGIFSDLVKTGQTIFNQLRDLIYVVAGFGIIAVAVGGFFGNLNWKWLGAIVISLVVIASAGELIVLMTGCKTFGSSLITNTLEEPTPMVATVDGVDPYTTKYNTEYTQDDGGSSGRIEWGDHRDMADYYVNSSGGGSMGAAPTDAPGVETE